MEQGTGLVKMGTELQKIGTELEKIGTELVKLGTELVLLYRCSDYRNNSERFFRKFRIRNEVPIIGTSGNPGPNRPPAWQIWCGRANGNKLVLTPTTTATPSPPSK